MRKRLLCIWLPNWPIQRLQSLPLSDALDSAGQNNGSMPNHRAASVDAAPTILWKADPRRGRLVVACCRRAASMGVRVGMPIAQANETARLANLSPIVYQHDPALDQVAIERLATEVQRSISPVVAIETLDDRPWAGHPLHQSESLLCDIIGIAHLFGGEIGLLQAAENLFSDFGLNAQMAIADSLGAAWALAHYAAKRTLIAPINAGQESIEPLPVEALRIDPQTVATLDRLGVSRIDQLLRLPRAGLATRLGTPLVRRIGQATGEIDEPLVVHRPPADDTHTCELEYPTGNHEILANRIEQLIRKARAGLATRKRGALRLTCRLDLAVHPPLTFEVGLFAPTLDTDHLSCLMISRLETQTIPSDVVRLVVSVTLTAPLRSSQTSLFNHDPDGSCNEGASGDWMSGSAVSRLVDSLSGRLGREAVAGVMIEDDPLPEKACSVFPLTGNSLMPRTSPAPSALRHHKTAKSSPRHAPRYKASLKNNSNNRSTNSSVQSWCDLPSRDGASRRPLTLLSVPIPLMEVVPSSSLSLLGNQLPACFRLAGQAHQVVRYWGPERIETGWWHAASVRRDYYRVETNRGHWWWIFRDLKAKSQGSRTRNGYRWMLHGRFD